jgi:hypothetical protein
MAASTSTHLATVLVVSALASAAPPVTIFAVNHTTGMTLAVAAGEVAAALRRASSDIVVRLAPGEHLVPAGGLRLGPEHTPAEARHTVTWQGAGAASVSSACNVTGWAPAPASAGFPAGTVAAPAPAALGGAVVRHLWVDGVRAPRTRRALGAALSGGSLALQPDGPAGYPLGYMSGRRRWRPGLRRGLWQGHAVLRPARRPGHHGQEAVPVPRRRARLHRLRLRQPLGAL